MLFDSIDLQKVARAGLVAALCLWPGAIITITAQQTTPTAPAAQKGATMTGHASGTFEVAVKPLSHSAAAPAPGKDSAAAPAPGKDSAAAATLGRMSLDKQYHGELNGIGIGEMLTAGAVAKGSAGYVAIEQVSGTLAGRKGSFVLQHSGTMKQGALSLTITVVPDSGTEELAGISGQMTITVKDGKHYYDFEYTLGESH